MTRITVFLWLGSIYQINGQFPNFFNAMMSGGGGGGSGNKCLTSVISCMPWCQRGVDSNGCLVCNCQSGLGVMNPMAGPMLGGLTPGAGTMDGTIQQPSDCPAAPRTCPYPPPWCQRLVSEKGCVHCLCGQDLMNFQNSLDGQHTAITTKSSTLLFSVKPTGSIPLTQTTTSFVQNCLLTFTCAKQCQFGFRTDQTGCPLCECITGGMVDVTVAATDPPGKSHVTSPSSTQATTDVISCPGLFNCDVICNNGYKTDPSGCPKCECVL